MNKKDKQDLLKLADIIEKKHFFNKKTIDSISTDVTKTLPENKRDGSYFNLQHWFFDCGMPACVAGHAVVEFPKRFGYSKTIPFKPGLDILSPLDFMHAFNLDNHYKAWIITMADAYKSKNPNPKTVAKRIREVVAAC